MRLSYKIEHSDAGHYLVVTLSSVSDDGREWDEGDIRIPVHADGRIKLYDAE